MFKKKIQKYLISYVIRNLQNKTTMRYYYISIRIENL